MGREAEFGGRYGERRFFLKDTIRQQMDFSRTGQSRGVAPPPMQKPVPGTAERIGLPGGAEALAGLARMPVGEAIIARESRRDFGPAPFSLEELSALLWAVQGVREVLSPAAALRAVPSAGARHSFETYLAAEALGAGVCAIAAYDQEACDRLLGVDGEEEFTVYIAAAGKQL